MALVFLDVDGTLLPFSGSQVVPWRGELSSGSPLLGRLDPEAGARLAALPCRLVWATTWMEEANDVIAPLLGFPALPVLDWPEPTAEDAYFGLHPKTRAIVKYAGEESFSWIDDEITDADLEWVREHHPGRALLLPVDPARGVTEHTFNSLERWLSQGGSADRPDGKACCPHPIRAG